jgi:mRNA-degrading endonuclease RelE of RelBE toxin-antitoxin system
LEDEMQERIEGSDGEDGKIDLIKENPKRNSVTLQNPEHKGMRRYTIGDYRLIYLWCKEAMQMDGVGNQVEAILEADHIHENHLILIDVGDRDHIYDNYG